MKQTESMPIWKLIWRMVAYAPRLYGADTLFWLFIFGLPTLPGIVIQAFFDRLAETSDGSLQSPIVYVVLLLSIGMARIMAIFVGRITKTQHRFTMSALLRHNLLRQLMQRPGAEPLTIHNQAISTGQVLSFFRDDAAYVEDTVVGTNEIFGAAIFALVSLIILVRVNLLITLLVFVPLVAIALVIQWAEHRIKHYRRVSRQATQQVTGWIGELFSSVQAIQTSVAEEHVLRHFQSLNEQRRTAMVRDQVFTSAIGSSLENLVNLGTGLTLLIAAQFMTNKNSLSLGDFALFVYYLGFITDFLWFLGGFLALVKQTEVSFERMGDLISGTADPSSTNTAKVLTGLTAHAPLYLHDLKGKRPLIPAIPPLADSSTDSLNELRIEGLTYQYPESDRGIQDISFTLKRGTLTVITGPVGSGKTTLVRTLLGLLPSQAGVMYWNGQRIEHPSLFFIPPRSAYTPQVPQLFTGTLSDNVQLGREVGSETLKWAIAHSILNPDIATMPAGLNTRIGVKGTRLSGGQRQRVAIARALVHQPELLVFDALSSALDVRTELQLWRKLFTDVNEQSLSLTDLSWQPTYLVVSHHPTLLQKADQVLCLENGNAIVKPQ